MARLMACILVFIHLGIGLAQKQTPDWQKAQSGAENKKALETTFSVDQRVVTSFTFRLGAAVENSGFEIITRRLNLPSCDVP
ncbi:hypothetical protein ACUHMQ_12935 [Chitinimonas sp. PSY-7]|uniref:hypothetical protein n=1 Tax=Chitinimonas sp. PSY-7 TaxID=3459088 RepID=UPI00403FC8DF